MFVITVFVAVTIEIVYTDVHLDKLINIVMMSSLILCILNTLFVVWIIKKLINARKRLSLECEDIEISINNNMEFMSRLLNNKIIEDEIYGILKIENFPDENIKTKKSIDGLNRVKIRRYTIVGDEKILKKLEISSEKINYITEILC